MTRNRFYQAKRHIGNGNNLTLSKARGLFLEDNDDIDMKHIYKITNVHPPRDEKDVVNKEYCDNNLLSSSNKIDILSKNITELRKGDFDKVTTKTLQLAILLQSKLLDNKEKDRLEMQYSFNQEDIMKEIERIFTNENK